jgi:hypothetical protein
MDPRPTEKIGAMPGAGRASRIYLYLAIFAVALTLPALILLVWGLKGHDHFASIPLIGNPDFYRDFGGRAVPEIQDQELFYHNLGGSVDAARKADIIFLGPSFVSYALDKMVLRQFEAAHRHRVYNMSFIGIRGGEFSRRIITRWGIEAPLWVINADDQFIHFFSTALDLTLGPTTTLIPATRHFRLRGFLSVAARNMRWRAEDYLSYYRTGDGSAHGIYRSISTGDATIDVNPQYVADTNKEIPFDRNRDCHTNAKTIAIARQYLRDIGGRVVLTLVPHSQYCPAQAFELAKALGIEILVPPDAGYTTVDGGGHLDRKGAIKFTNFLMTELVKTDAYQKAFNRNEP